MLAGLLLRLLGLTMLVALPAPAAMPAPGEPVVSAIRFGQEGPRTRIVVEVDAPIAFEAAALSDPPRLVVDLPRVTWRIRSDPLGNPRGLATGHRYGLFDPERSRLVIDLKAPFHIADRFMLPPPDGRSDFRLVIDLEAGGAMVATGAPATVAALPPARPPSPAVRDAAPARPGKVPVPRLRPKPVIAIDPGHGGVDPGAIAVTGVAEKEITLAMGFELRDRLLATGRYRVVMTRESDRYVALRDRIKIAREHGAALFLSLHADSLPDGRTRGASVYTLSERASDAEAERLAATENKADALAGADLSSHDPIVAGILIDLSRRDTSNNSIRLAELLVEELREVTRLVRNTRRYAGFVVLKAPDVPSVLIELGYLSQREDARALMDTRIRTRLAGAIVRAVDRQLYPIR